VQRGEKTRASARFGVGKVRVFVIADGLKCNAPTDNGRDFRGYMG